MGVWYKINLFSLRAGLFADAVRAGVELTVPTPFRSLLRRRVAHHTADVIRDNTGPRSQPPAPLNLEPELRARIESTLWYHTIELAPGYFTPGTFDHNPILHKYKLPQSFSELRVLDVATFDGFWAFEFERRGAAEVVALDVSSRGELDLPVRVRQRLTTEELKAPIGIGFSLAQRALRSKVRHMHLSVYDLDPNKTGMFDVVHSGDLLLHLRDPALALARIAAVTKGYAIISDCFSPELDRFEPGKVMDYQSGCGETVWWKFSRDALHQMIYDAGFDRVEEVSRFKYGFRNQLPSLSHIVFRASR